MVSREDRLARELHPSSARTGLNRTGSSICLAEHLRFQLDHARARDAVHAALDVPSILEALRSRNLNPFTVMSLVPVDSTGTHRHAYLRRPDLGRRLSAESLARIEELQSPATDIAIIIADGLSAIAVERHAIPLLDALLPNLNATLAPTAIATQGRVAIGDEIACALHAQIAIVLIGERPGLSAPDSLGVYLTWNPQPGKTSDAQRACISNVRTQGLSYISAAERILELIHQAKRLGHTGVYPQTPARLGG